MIDILKKQVYEANLLLPKYGLVVLTWGNVSAIDREKGIIVIKPSGVNYDDMTPDKMVVVDMNGKIVSGDFKPSSDLMTHLELYKRFDCIGSIIHTHSRWATIWSQMGEEIPPFGTTHADVFNGAIKCTENLSDQKINDNYECNIGRQIADTIDTKYAEEIPAILVKNHGPFIWGKTINKAIENAVTLEEVAMIGWHMKQINGCENNILQDSLLKKHYYRKNGDNSYYGQR
ncbi:L-ribulose-5-phosphate 4-epimerase AraD [Clostridium botulinum]|nr:L-ribulose-5-phosphate 4-epimerase AraD [Clostridium botulinum]